MCPDGELDLCYAGIYTAYCQRLWAYFFDLPDPSLIIQ